MVRHLLAVLVGLAIAVPAWAQSVTLQLDTDRLEVAQRTGFSVVVRGVRPRTIPRVALPEGLDVVFTGQSRQQSIVNGRMDSFVSYRYDLVAREEGTWTVGPAIVEVPTPSGGTRDVESRTVQLEVVPATPRDDDDAPVRLEVGFDEDRAWQGQTVIYRYALTARVELAGARWFGHPDEGLMVPADGRPERKDYVVRGADGAQLVDETWQPFVVTGSGPLRWDPPAVEVDLVVGGGGGLPFFRRSQRQVFTADALSLDVRPLPEPPDGYSGLVGSFSLRALLNDRRVAVGESVTWSLHIDGDGSLEGFQLPAPDTLEGARVYDGTTRPRSTMRRGAFRAGITFERTVVPTREGRLTLPPVELIVFDPEVGDYVTLTSEALSIDVTPGEDDALAVTSFADDEGLMDRLLGESEGDEDDIRAWRSSGPGRRLPWLAWLPGLLVLAASPALGVGALTGMDAVRDARARRAERAPVREATPLERLHHLPDEDEARHAALDDALRLALARAAGVAPERLDRDDALATLDANLAQRVREVIATLDRVRFAGAPTPPDLVERVRAAVDALETR